MPTIEATEMNLRFPGQYWDRETNTHYNFHRDYLPGVGRYTQFDPIGLAGGPNGYAYVGGNPLSKVDPDGLQAIPLPPPIIPPPAIPNPDNPYTPAPPSLTWPELLPDSWVDWIIGKVKGKWSCTASCNVQQINPNVCCPDRVTGTAGGPNEPAACVEAKRVATQSTPAGCYPRHCQCRCSKR